MNYQLDPQFWKIVAMGISATAFFAVKGKSGRWPFYWAARLLCCIEAAVDRAWDSAVAAVQNFRMNYRQDVARVRRDVAGEIAN